MVTKVFFKRRAMKRQEEKRREKGEKSCGCLQQLTLLLPLIVYYSDWLMLTDRCVVIGCLLINSCDTYRSMIVRFASPTTRGFSRCFELSLSSLVSSWRRKPLGPG